MHGSRALVTPVQVRAPGSASGNATNPSFGSACTMVRVATAQNRLPEPRVVSSSGGFLPFFHCFPVIRQERDDTGKTMAVPVRGAMTCIGLIIFLTREAWIIGFIGLAAGIAVHAVMRSPIRE
jgi:hypothetical protein